MEQALWKHFLELLDTNRIFTCEQKHLQFVYPTYLITQTQPDGTPKIRAISNLKFHNVFTQAPPFKMATPEQAIFFLRNRLCVSFDLTKAYYQFGLRHFNVFGSYVRNPKTRKLVFFEHHSLIFGWNVALYLCTRLLTPFGIFLKSLGFAYLVYFDDFLIALSETNQQLPISEVERRLDFLLFLFSFVGLQLNNKSVLNPSSQIIFLGKHLNLTFKFYLLKKKNLFV